MPPEKYHIYSNWRFNQSKKDSKKCLKPPSTACVKVSSSWSANFACSLSWLKNCNCAEHLTLTLFRKGLLYLFFCLKPETVTGGMDGSASANVKLSLQSLQARPLPAYPVLSLSQRPTTSHHFARLAPKITVAMATMAQVLGFPTELMLLRLIVGLVIAFNDEAIKVGNSGLSAQRTAASVALFDGSAKTATAIFHDYCGEFPVEGIQPRDMSLKPQPR